MTQRQLRRVAESFCSVISMGLAVSSAVAMPARVWSGIDMILVRCSVRVDLAAPTAQRLCDAIFAEVGRQAPYPVRRFGVDEGAASSPRSLLLDARVDAAPASGTTLSILMRKAVSVDDSEGEITRPPNPLAMDSTPDALAISIAHALDRTLPWRRRTGRDFPPDRGQIRNY